MRFNLLHIIYFGTIYLGISTLAVPALAAEEKAKQVPSLASSVVSVILALIFIIAIIVACAWLLKRMGGGGFQKSAGIEVKASHMLGAKERLVIVKVDGRHLLLGVTPQSINKLDELSDDCITVEAPTQMSFQDAFSTQLKKMIGKNHEK